MPVRIGAIPHDMTPIACRRRTQLSRAGVERALVRGRRVVHDEVNLGPRYSVAFRGIRDRVAEQSLDSALRHKTEDTAVAQFELGHAGNEEARLDREDRRVEASAAILVRDVENEVNGLHRFTVSRAFLNQTASASSHRSPSVRWAIAAWTECRLRARNNDRRGTV